MVRDVSAIFVAITTYNYSLNNLIFQIFTFLEPGGAGSKIRVCISDGRAP